MIFFYFKLIFFLCFQNILIKNKKIILMLFQNKKKSF
jgi:hypothetical protein